MAGLLTLHILCRKPLRVPKPSPNEPTSHWILRMTEAEPYLQKYLKRDGNRLSFRLILYDLYGNPLNRKDQRDILIGEASEMIYGSEILGGSTEEKEYLGNVTEVENL